MKKDAEELEVRPDLAKGQVLLSGMDDAGSQVVSAPLDSWLVWVLSGADTAIGGGVPETWRRRLSSGVDEAGNKVMPEPLESWCRWAESVLEGPRRARACLLLESWYKGLSPVMQDDGRSLADALLDAWFKWLMSGLDEVARERAFHLLVAWFTRLVTGLDEATLNPKCHYGRLVSESCRPNGNVDLEKYWERFKKLGEEQQFGILADIDSLHWSIVRKGPSNAGAGWGVGAWVSFWNFYQNPDAGEARYKAIHGATRARRREAAFYLAFAKEVDSSGDVLGRELLATWERERRGATGGRFFYDLAEEIKQATKVKASKGGKGTAGPEQVFITFCRLHIESEGLPTKVEVALACPGAEGKNATDASKWANYALGQVGLNGLPVDRRHQSYNSERLDAAVQVALKREGAELSVEERLQLEGLLRARYLGL